MQLFYTQWQNLLKNENKQVYYIGPRSTHEGRSQIKFKFPTIRSLLYLTSLSSVGRFILTKTIVKRHNIKCTLSW